MPTSATRRDFFKTAVAATVAGIAAPAQATTPPPPAATPTAHPATPASAPESLSFPRTFTGRHLARVSCPLGGIATGGIGLGGRGNLQDWQIFNRPDYGNALEYAFPSIWVKTATGDPFAAVIERRLLPPYDLQQEGLGFQNVPGLPRFQEAHFHASFPLSKIDFEDPICPVQVSLDAFSPFQPLEADDSGLPCAILTYQVHNPGKSAVEVAIAWSITNPVGSADSRHNAPRTAPNISGLLMTDPAIPADDPLFGSFALAALAPTGTESETLPSWRGGSNWRVGPQDFWFENFAPNGRLGTPSEPSTPVGSVSLRQSVPAGQSRAFRFLLAWHFPNRSGQRSGWESPKGQEKVVFGNHYCARFADAWAALEYTTHNLTSLEAGTRAFAQALAESTLPAAVKDAASSNLTTLVSNTSVRIADGSFHGFEGCGDREGLGFGSCTHVWNYEVATQFLFPSLARSMRETSFGYATDPEGHMDFRHKLPLGHEHWGAAAADGQMGQIVKLYMDWTLSGDDAWLRRQWPAAKRALAYAWRPGGWDERRSGVMDGVQHNTFDVEFYGPNPMCSTWYLAALRAAARMARAMAEQAFAADCDRMANEGSAWLDANLFNGEYYIQHIRPIPQDKIASGLQVGMGARDSLHPVFQVGEGCLIDQLVGQYMASVAGLGDLLNPQHIRKTLDSLLRYNLKRDLTRHASVQRVYALNDEAAMVICDFPHGNRPAVPMPYYAEIMTGFEYSAAALMIAHGLVPDGISIIANIRRRYDGERANPFDETEYGRHYARAMASWAGIPLLSGFQYDGRAHALSLAPRLAANPFRSFWSTPSAWGTFTLTPASLSLTVHAGALSLRQLSVAPLAAHKLSITTGSAPAAHKLSTVGPTTRIYFDTQVAVTPGNPLTLTATHP